MLHKGLRQELEKLANEYHQRIAPLAEATLLADARLDALEERIAHLDAAVQFVEATVLKWKAEEVCRMRPDTITHAALRVLSLATFLVLAAYGLA